MIALAMITEAYQKIFQENKQLKKTFTSLSDVMIDSDVPAFFKRATGRDYKSHETCVNDIRRICGMYFAEEIERRINTLNAEQGG